ncbi:MAG TPA: hypothetical protein VNG93_08595 [Candidatus Dormibacteraeota bacterium]|nr:hypothetical protein [Candidatus Dormibacteraeota bacterium]
MRALRIGEDVLASDGSRFGQVERLVVDEGAHQVTHLVVDDRVIPLEHIRDAGPDGLSADLSPDELSKLPRHEEAGFAAPGEHWQAPPGYGLANFLAVAGALLGNAPYLPPVEADLTPGEVFHEISAGSPVWAGDNRIGHVVELLTNDRGRTTELVIAREGLLGKQVVVPIAKVIEVVGVNVQVELNETDVALLEPYRREEA